MRYLVILFALLCLPLAASGQSRTALHVLEGEAFRQAVAKVERYFNTLKSFEARFEQINPDGSASTGYFVMKKPGKVLWHYTTPDPLRLISDGGLIYFEDMTTKQVTQVPREGFARLLTEATLDLNKAPFKIVEAMHVNGFYHLRMKQSASKDVPESELLFTFIDEPLQLRQVVTYNQFGDEVSVTFFQINENGNVADSLFRFTPPQYREN